MIKAAPGARAFSIVAPEEFLTRVVPIWWGFYSKFFLHQYALQRGDIAQQLSFSSMSADLHSINLSLFTHLFFLVPIHRPSTAEHLVLFSRQFWDKRENAYSLNPSRAKGDTIHRYLFGMQKSSTINQIITMCNRRGRAEQRMRRSLR